jgi:hypothetical protein
VAPVPARTSQSSSPPSGRHRVGACSAAAACAGSRAGCAETAPSSPAYAAPRRSRPCSRVDRQAAACRGPSSPAPPWRGVTRPCAWGPRPPRPNCNASPDQRGHSRNEATLGLTGYCPESPEVGAEEGGVIRIRFHGRGGRMRLAEAAQSSSREDAAHFEGMAVFSSRSALPLPGPPRSAYFKSNRALPVVMPLNLIVTT